MTRQKSLLKPSIELLVAGLFWGFGFVATIWALPFLSPAAIITYRFLTAFVVGACVLPWVRGQKIVWKDELQFSLVSGLLLGLCLFLQTWGLETTSATNSGFITTLYVVIVPFMARVFLKEKLHGFHWVCIAIAILGTAMIVQIKSLEFRIGDLLTLACAVVASLQIVYIGWIGERSKNAFVLNSLQCFWAGFPFLISALWGKGQWSLQGLDTKAWIGMISLTFGSTVLAFFLQLRAQKQMPPSLASLFYLLESPFSCLFAVFLLGERLSVFQSFGALLILFACLIAVLAEHRKRQGTEVVP